ncbi:MAG: hypothetical protein DCC67_02825 [Planctomycetota bacterium]|nr:MAG: hypothetical protein DCC67_02825 [Planctomycetota bacterium]
MCSRTLLRSLYAVALLTGHCTAAESDTSGIAWRTNLDAARLEAAQTGRLLLLHFTTKSCGPCRMLDKQVFNQPQVGKAVEQDFVPVRIDANASPAIARMYKVEEVPKEIITTSDGNPVFTPQIPNAAEHYVAQLQNLARHFRQTTGPAAAAAGSAAVNPAYAALPVSRPANPLAASGSPAGGSAAAQQPAPATSAPTQQPMPQAQSNPFVATGDAARYGQAPSVYSSATQAGPGPAAAPAAPAVSQQVVAAPPAATPAAAPTANTAEPVASPPAVAVQAACPAPASVAGAAASTVGAPAPASSAASGAAAVAAAQAPVAAAETALAGSATASAPAAAPQPRKIELPAGSPPLGFEGYCPVTLKTLKRWSLGDVQYGVIHRGRTYLFIGAAERDQFLADPDSYSPVFAGMDPVLLIDRQESVEGNRRFGYEYGGAFYLFSSKETMQRFAATPQAYAAGVRQAMLRIDGANAPLRR